MPAQPRRSSSSPTLIPERSVRVRHRLQVQHPCPHRGAHHRHREARPLLVGPHRHLHRCAGLDPMVVERLDHLEPAQHAVHAVEAPAGGLGVEVAAEHNRRSVGVGASSAGEEVAHSIELDRAAGPLSPADEQLPAGLVVVGEGLPVGAPGRGRPHLGHVHQPRPEPVGIGVQISHGPNSPMASTSATRMASTISSNCSGPAMSGGVGRHSRLGPPLRFGSNVAL